MAGPIRTRIEIDADARDAVDELSAVERAALDADTAVERLDTSTITIDIDDSELIGVRNRIDDVTKSADSSKSVLANMVGNATQDLGALGGVAGSVGVAIGQMGEYMADAAAAGERFGSILQSFGKVVGPIAALSAGLAVLSKIQSNNAQASELNAASTERWADAMKSGTDAAGAYVDALAESGKVMLDLNHLTDDQNRIVNQSQHSWHGLDGIFQLFHGDVEDVSSVMAEAGLTVEQLARAVEAGARGVEAWTAAVENSNVSEADQARLLALLTQETEAQTRAKERATQAEQIFARTLYETSNAAEIISRSIELAKTNLERFGADGVEQMNTIKEALDDTGAALQNFPSFPTSSPAPTRGSAQPLGPQHITIINPPGTPATTVQSSNIYVSRNGVRSGP